MPQTSVSYPSIGQVGRRSRDTLGDESRSAHLGDATAVGFGLAVVRDSGGAGWAKLPSATGQQFFGVSENDDRHAVDQSGGTRYIQNDEMRICRKGVIFVLPEVTVAEGDPVYFRHTANGVGKAPGQFRNNSDGAVSGTKRKQTLTLSGPLDGGRAQKQTYTWNGAINPGTGTRRQQTLTLSGALDGGKRRVQTLTFNQAMVALETVKVDVDGTTTTVITFDTNNDTTLRRFAEAIKAAGVAAAAGPAGKSSITNCEVREVAAADGSKNRVIEIESFESATSCALTNVVVTTAAGLTCTPATAVAGVEGHSLTCTIDGGVAVVQQWTGTSDGTLQAWADQIAQYAGVFSAIVTKVTDTTAPNSDRVITVISTTPGAATTVIAAQGASNGATARTVALAGSVPGVAGTGSDTFGLTVDGQAITVQQFQGDNDNTLREIAAAILEASIAAGLGPDGTPTIEKVNVRPVGAAVTDNRVVEIVSKPGYATTFAALAWTNTSGSGVTCSAATPVANANPHRLSVQLDGGAALITEWRGTSDQTLQDFADLLASQAAIESAEVTHVTDVAGAPYGESDTVITVTAATPGPAENAFTNPLCTGGANARTLAVAQTVAGVAVVAGKADLIANAIWLTGGSASQPAELQLNLP